MIVKIDRVLSVVEVQRLAGLGVSHVCVDIGPRFGVSDGRTLDPDVTRQIIREAPALVGVRLTDDVPLAEVIAAIDFTPRNISEILKQLPNLAGITMTLSVEPSTGASFHAFSVVECESILRTLTNG